MSVIQSIRDKAAWIIIGAIALALIAFIVQDALQGGGRGFFSGNSTTLGKVNGTKIDYRDFEQRYKIAEENYRAQNYPVNDQLSNQIRESLWNEYIDDALMGEEYKKLGMIICDKEASDILYGANPPQMFRQQFIDSTTGNYDAQAAYQAVKSLKKNSSQYKNFWGEFVPALEKGRQREKFTALLGKSMYIPKWLVEKTNAENSQRAAISYVNVPYSSISDSTVKVTDEDVRQYVAKHKEIYKQENERSLVYVSIDAGPSSADSVSFYSQLAQQRDTLAKVPAADIQKFLLNNSSETPYYDGYVLSSHMQMGNADTLRKLADGQVFGPYVDGGNYTLARMVARRNMPDSVKCRHILVKISDQQGQTRTDSAAKKLIDSIEAAIKGGANFDSMVVKYSDDAGSKDKKGEYEFTSMQFSNLSKEFAQVIFYGNTGDKKVVKVDNSSYVGYHYIEVLSQKHFETAYEIAYLSHPIVPSNETMNNASGIITQFLGESRNLKAFEDNSTKRKLNKFPTEVKETDMMIMGLGEARELIRWAFNDAKEGEVADHPFMIGNKYVVPVVTGVREKGVMSVEKARPLVEYKIRNLKKGDEIIKKIGSAATLEAVAQVTGQQILRADSIAFSANFIPNVGNELKVLGASFNKEYQAKISGPIKGEMGVFVIKVDAVFAQPSTTFDAMQMQQSTQQQMGSMIGYRTFEIMKKSADIKDYRIKFF